MSRILVSLFGLSFAISASAQTATTPKQTAPAPAPPQSFKAGGTSIIITTPVTDMVEVGALARAKMEGFVPPTNRLLAGFAITKELPEFDKTDGPIALSRYAMAQIHRASENVDVEASDFSLIVENMKVQFGPNAALSREAAESEIARRLRSMNIDETVRLGEPTLLGTLFSKTDAYGFGMVEPVSVGNQTLKLAMGLALVRVKKHALFLYLYAEYHNEETVTWLRQAIEQWAAAVVASNR